MTTATAINPAHRSKVEHVHSTWTSLYTLGGISALLMVLIIIIQLIVFMSTPPVLATWLIRI